jgi:hypothetical protein
MSVSFDKIELKRHLFEYRHEGSEWGVEIMAASRADAIARLKAVAWAQYRGEVFAKLAVPGTRKAGWLSKLLSRHS